MSDLIDDPVAGFNQPEFTVSEISGAIKRLIEGEFSHIRLKGEIGRVSYPRSGHVYLDLKDEKSVISAVVWKGVAARLPMRPEEGLEVVATGRVTTFAGQSKYQLIIEDLKPAGVGALMAMLEKRKAQLAAEGLFDAGRKKPLPYLPDVIGVVTSPSGAVIRDILHRLRDRFPRQVLIWPVAVQGARCAGEVSRAIAGFNALEAGGAIPRPDLLIVARGGGSLEDLWGFNEESVARAAAASDIPLISAVGHETDTTLIDYVSDKRAPTPTAAAELAVPVRHELAAWVNAQDARMSQALSTSFGRNRQRVADLARALPRLETILENPRQRLDFLSERLPTALHGLVQSRRLALSETAGRLNFDGLRQRLKTAGLKLHACEHRLDPALRHGLQHKQDILAQKTQQLHPRALRRDIAQGHKDLAQLARRLRDATDVALLKSKQQLDGLERLRETLGYKATLHRGYAVVRAQNTVIISHQAAKAVSGLEIEFADGRFAVGEPRAKPARAHSKSSDQGSLF